MARGRNQGDSLQRFIALSGAVVEKRSVGAFTRASKQFTTHVNGPSLADVENCGELANQIIAICLSKPEFLHAPDCERYAAFRQDFCDCRLRLPVYPKDVDAKGSEVPIRFLKLAIETWVGDCLDRDSKLLPHYALDTGELIRKMIVGSDHSDPETWELAPVFGADNALERLWDLFDKSFKRRFTERSSLAVLARVPEGRAILSHGKELIAAGTPFEFHFQRCHLSQIIYDFKSLFADQDQARPKYDLMEGFLLDGNIVSQQENKYGGWDKFPFALPPDWITHELHDSSRSDEPVCLPVPFWHSCKRVETSQQ